MEASILSARWISKELTEVDIYDYLVGNIGATNYYKRDVIMHVSECCYAIYLWSIGSIPDLGSFGRAVVANDLTEAVHCADEDNKLALWLYVAFLYNVAPGGWKDRFQKEPKEELND
jgi:hypothetical protein